MNGKPVNFSLTSARLKAGLLPLILVMALSGCDRNREKARAPSPLPPQSAAFKSQASTVLSAQRAVPLMRMELNDSLEVPFQIDADERRSLVVVAPAAGRLEQVMVRSADQFVKAGETLALLYAPELVAAQREYLLLVAAPDSAMRSQAGSRLRQMGMTSDQIATLGRLGKPLERFPIRSPLSGFVLPGNSGGGEAGVAGNMGQKSSGGSGAMGGMEAGGGDANTPTGKNSPVSPANAASQAFPKAGVTLDRGATLATLNDLNVVAATLAMPIDQAEFFRVGDSVHLSLASLGYSAMARIDYLESRVSDTNQSVTAKVYLRNPGWKLKVGALGKAHLAAELGNAWILPRASVHGLGEKWIVWVRSTIDSTAFQAREVRLGRRSVRYVEIVRGLSPGESVAEDASLLLDPDAVVQPLALPQDSGSADAAESSHSSRMSVQAEPTVSTSEHSSHGVLPTDTQKDTMTMAMPENGSAHAAGHEEGNTHGGPATPIRLTKEEEVLAGIQTVKASISPVTPIAQFRATTRYDDRSSQSITARVDGTLEKVQSRRPGDNVVKGQILAEIRSDNLLSAQQEFLLAIGQSKSLPDKAMARSQSDASRRRLRVLGMEETQINALLAQGHALQLQPIVSPSAGTLLEVTAQAGQYVQAGTPLFIVGGSDRIWVETWMLPEETTLYPEGTDAFVKIEGLEGGPVQGRLEHIRQGTSTSGSLVAVHIGVPNSEGKIHPGLQAWVTVKQPSRPALNIPLMALLESSDHTMAWIREGDHQYAPRRIKTGIRTNLAAEILEGIKPGDEVVIAGAYLLNSEAVIRQGAGAGHAGH